MAGLPPFNGFLSKEMFLKAMLSVTEFELFNFSTWGIIFPIIAWIASVFTFIYSFYFVFRTFTGKGQVDRLTHKPHEAPVGMLISPVILASLVVVLFFIPNVLADTFIKPAVMAIQPFLYSSPEQVDIDIAAWHGHLTTELLMTIGIIALGLILFLTLSKWQKMYSLFPSKLTLNNLYDFIIYELFDRWVGGLSRVYMTGSIRRYLSYMLGAISIIVIATLFIQNAFKVTLDGSSPIRIYQIILIIVLVIGTIATVFAKSRITSIVSLGLVGYTVSLFFVMFNAPDLALTQLVIETISVALFLLAFYHLPKYKKEEERTRFRFGRAFVSVAVGAMVTLVALSAHSQKLIGSISEYYKETVYSLAGGGNIVNVILVDYRGFDTLFEIAVLSIAGIAIFGMIKLRLSRKGEKL